MINLSPALKKYIETNVEYLDTWDQNTSRVSFYGNLPIDCLEEFNNLMLTMHEDVDIQETYRNVFDWLLYDVIVQDPKNDSFDIYTEEEGNVIGLEYETKSVIDNSLTDLWILYDIRNDSWSCHLDVDEQTRTDFYDYLTDDEMRMQGKGWAQFVNHLSSTLSWDCFQFARNMMLQYDPSIWPKD